MLCYLFSEPIYFIFTSDAPALLYYAYLPITILTLFIGLYVYLNGRRSLLSQIFFSICILFSLWTISTVIEWTNIQSNLIMFVWSFASVILSLIAILSIQFIYVFLNKENITNKIKLVLTLLVAPVLLLSPTRFNLSGFDITNCDAFKFEWMPFKLYYIFLGLVAMVWILVMLVHKYRTSDRNMKKQIVLMGTGTEIFLGLFFLWTSYTYYLAQVGAVSDSSLEMFGLFGMLIFLVYISILMVRFKIFNTKLLAAQALVVAMVALIGAQFFFIQNNTNRVLTAITLVFLVVLGFWLTKSVKKENEQFEKLKEVTKKITSLNLRLQELDQQKTDFLSIASHQLRTPLSIAKGYIELLMDGAYGDMTKPAKNVLKDMDESNEHLVKLVDGFLDITRIEQGRTKFSFEDYDVNNIVADVVKELKERAASKHLHIDYKPISNLKMINLDEEKVRHVVFNYIDNAIKYSDQGTIKVLVKEENKGVSVVVKDNGFGFNKEDEANFFQKFYRGKNVEGTNVGGTGLGIFICRKFIEAHNGYVWAHSPGLGKGSEFGFWIPFGPKSVEEANEKMKK